MAKRPRKKYATGARLRYAVDPFDGNHWAHLDIKTQRGQVEFVMDSETADLLMKLFTNFVDKDWYRAPSYPELELEEYPTEIVGNTVRQGTNPPSPD